MSAVSMSTFDKGLATYNGFFRKTVDTDLIDITEKAEIFIVVIWCFRVTTAGPCKLSYYIWYWSTEIFIYTRGWEIQNFTNVIYSVQNNYNLYREMLLYNRVTMHFLAWEFACGMLQQSHRNRIIANSPWFGWKSESWHGAAHWHIETEAQY